MELLPKLLARAGIGSRRACAEIIKQGRVTVNGVVAEHPGARVDPAHDRIAVDGREVRAATDRVYLLLHKPRLQPGR